MVCGFSSRFHGGTFCGSFSFCVCLCYIILSVSCSLLVICWERGDSFALLFVIFSGAFVTFPYSILGQVWYLIVSIPDICLLPSFGLQCNSVLFPGHNHVLFI